MRNTEIQAFIGRKSKIIMLKRKKYKLVEPYWH